MIIDYFKQFNWVDIVVILVVFRVWYISLKTGFKVEMFKLAGTIAAIYMAMHYFTVLSDYIRSRFSQVNTPPQLLDLFSFSVLAVAGYLIFLILRVALYRFVKVDVVQGLDRWGGLALGLIRGLLLASLVVFIFTISTLHYLKDSAASSYLGKRLFKKAPAVYFSLWNNLASKFSPSEQVNKAVIEIQDNF